MGQIGHLAQKWKFFKFFLCIFRNIWPNLSTFLESVIFFWIFETLKSKIEKISQKIFKGFPLWILGKMSGVSWCNLQLFLSIQIKTKYTEPNIFVSETKKKCTHNQKLKKVFFQPPLLAQWEQVSPDNWHYYYCTTTRHRK